MNDNDFILLSERVGNLHEAFVRLTLVVGEALPHTENQLSSLLHEYNRIGQDISDEYKLAQMELEDNAPDDQEWMNL